MTVESALRLSRPRVIWRQLARALADILPKGLYGRSLLIVILPMVLLQAAVAYVFMERHWELVTHRLSSAVARDVGAIIDLYKAYPPAAGDDRLKSISAYRFHIDVELLPKGPLPPPMPKTFFAELDPLTSALPEEIYKQIGRPFWIDTVGRSGLMEIRVDLGDGVLRMFAHRSLAYEANVHIFILWMLGAAIVLLAVAILFLRNQIRPILRLAGAAEDFGKGRDFDFRPHGAREVRQAGYAFIEMKRRVERALEQRTAMLNGVSHDLRTILTRFKLSLAVMDEQAEIEPLQKDVDEMQGMLEGYLAFARGDAGEATVSTDLRAILEELKADAERHGAFVSIEANGALELKVRPSAIKRCLSNLLANAQRHGRKTALQASREQRFIAIHVDDDGPGIAPEHREDVFRPFYRLDDARNQDEGGAGLGLAIARDIARSHGGDVGLGTSPMGGLRATVRLPV
ncbi:ATP-binding protein [Methylocapsa sp. S129]|uniref:ATP-binding protein n=1 Tax=Methylocapsa sp. S129 TaxID=1641869 RepID=UPI00131E7148|nr:ATP-binding protein [Methylocapsa sp. S129]